MPHDSLNGPVPGVVADFESVLACVNECFQRDNASGGMAARWPHCLRPTPEGMRQYLLMKDRGKVVACVGCIDQTLVVDGNEWRAAGIGQVSTLPDYRGRGLMSRLLEAAIGRMEREGYPLSELGGDRLRYGRYGWEPAGREWQFRLTARSVSASEAPEGYAIRKYEGTADEIEAIARLHDAEPRRVKRNREQYARLLGRAGREVWLAAEGSAVAAYAVTAVFGEAPWVVEYGGSAAPLRALLTALARRQDQSLTVWSPWAHPANGLLTELAASWQISSPRMLRIMDLTALLRGFANQLSARAGQLPARAPKRFALELAETAQRTTLVLSGGGVQVLSGADKDALSIPRRDLARLLFGPAQPSAQPFLPPAMSFLDALFPLDFTIWHNETV